MSLVLSRLRIYVSGTQGERGDNREQRRRRRQRRRLQELRNSENHGGVQGKGGGHGASPVAASSIRMPIFLATFLLERFGVKRVAMQVHLQCILYLPSGGTVDIGAIKAVSLSPGTQPETWD